MNCELNVNFRLRCALASGPVPVRDLEMRAVAAGLLLPDVKISQCKAFRRTADTLGVQRYQAGRRWYWMLPAPAAAPQVSDTLNPDLNPVASSGAGGVETPDISAASETSASGVPQSSDDTIADHDRISRMTKEEFIKFSIANRRALALEADAEAKIRVVQILEKDSRGQPGEETAPQ
jgi:hypothetical protein